MKAPHPPARVAARLPLTVKAAVLIWFLAATMKFTMAIMLITLGHGERAPTGAAIQMMLGIVLFYMARRTFGALERDLLGLIILSAIMGLVNAWTGLKARSAAEIAVLVQGASLLLAGALALIGRSGYRAFYAQVGQDAGGADRR